MPRKKKAPKKTRRAKGSGSIFPDARRGGYRAKVPIGRYPNGKTRYRELRADTQAGVVALMRTAQPADPVTVTVGEWADRWLTGCTASEPTLRQYRNTVTHYIKPTLGQIRLAALTPHDLDRAAVEWAKPKGGLGPNTLRGALGRVAAMLEAARRARLLTENVATLTRRPKGKRVSIRPFARPELKRVVAEAALAPGDRLFALLASVGCRIGEALALDVPDLDAAGRVTIGKTYCARHGLRAPKSDNGYRTVRVPAPALPALRAAAAGRTKGPLFPNPLGGRYGHSGIAQRWAALLKRLKLDPRNMHQLRHSVATHALAAGVPLPNVARDLGDTIKTIVSTYLHETDGPDVCGAMERVLGDDKGAVRVRSGAGKSRT